MLIAEQLSKAFDGPDGRITVLDGADLSLAPGARLGLVGPSGCGKSTLAGVLALLVAPDSGRVVLNGEPVVGHRLAVPKQIRRQVQLVWQSPRQAADPRLTLRQTILEPLAIHRELPAGAGEQWDLTVAWAARMGLTSDLLRRYPHEVSDGQLQRACLARALPGAALPALRRADLDAGRVYPGRVARGDRRGAAALRARAAAHHPRRRRGAALV